jgi:hypothetical protein
MQPWPKPKKSAVKGRSSARTPELRPRPKLTGVESGVKGQDERQKTAPLTPLPTPIPHHALDTANAVRDVNPLRSQQNIFHRNNRFHTNHFPIFHTPKIVGIVVMLNLLSLR